MLLENETMTLILGGCEITVQATLSAAVCQMIMSPVAMTVYKLIMDLTS